MFSRFPMSSSNNYILYILSVKTAGQKMSKSALVVQKKVYEFIDKFHYLETQTIRKSPDKSDKSGEICFGLVKYFNFLLINMFKFPQKYKNVW